jgi:hypothetical protein
VNQQAPENSPTSPNSGWRTAALLLGVTLAVLLGLLGALFISGWRFERVNHSPTSNELFAAAEKWSPPLGPGESAASRAKRLARDLASLSLASTNRPDPAKVLTEARDLANKGRYEDALQRHIWYHNHALEYDPAQGGARLSFALSDWMELARKFPKAKQALEEIRDRDTRGFAEGRGDFTLFQDVRAINGFLQAEDETVALFEKLVQRDRALASQCYWAAEDLLVQKGRYGLCLACIPDFEATFDVIKRSFAPMPGMSRTNGFELNRFVRETRSLVEILIATGHKSEAEKIRTKALAVSTDPRLDSAIRDAERKLPR